MTEQGISGTNGWIQRGGEEDRRHLRYPLQLQARLSLGGIFLHSCTIENFSQHGLAVVVTATSDADRDALSGIQRGHILEISFPLPGDGRQVRGKAQVEHFHANEQRVMMGLSMRQSHPIIFDAMFAASSLNRSRGTGDIADGASTPAHTVPLTATTSTVEVPALATTRAPQSVPETPSVVVVPTTVPTSPPAPTQCALDTITLDAQLSEICDHFLSSARTRMFQCYETHTTHAGEYFRGLVALQGEQSLLEGRLRTQQVMTGAWLMRRFVGVVAGLDVNDVVRDELRAVFNEIVESTVNKLAKAA